MPLSDIACLAVLDSLETRATLPADCDRDLFIQEGLIEDVDGRCQLTVKGRLYLANLRTLERQRLKD